MPRRTTWTRLDDMMERLMPRKLWVKLEIGSESCWDCEIKFITHSNPGSVDAGVTFYKAAGQTAEEVLCDCLDALDQMVHAEQIVTAAMTATLEDEA